MRRNSEVLARAMDRDPAIVSRFWSYVDKGESDESCWNWCGHTNEGGTGRFCIGQTTIAPAKVAWYSVTGEMPAVGRMIRICENDSCVRPDHLAWGMSESSERALSAERGGYVSLSGNPIACAGPMSQQTSPRMRRFIDGSRRSVV
jgi:hypothetical protein